MVKKIFVLIIFLTFVSFFSTACFAGMGAWVEGDNLRFQANPTYGLGMPSIFGLIAIGPEGIQSYNLVSESWGLPYALPTLMIPFNVTIPIDELSKPTVFIWGYAFLKLFNPNFANDPIGYSWDYFIWGDLIPDDPDDNETDYDGDCLIESITNISDNETAVGFVDYEIQIAPTVEGDAVYLYGQKAPNEGWIDYLAQDNVVTIKNWPEGEPIEFSIFTIKNGKQFWTNPTCSEYYFNDHLIITLE